jgi:3-mercaptopyruvate sulfurtransferase SseA
MLIDRGFKMVRPLAGGFDAWVEAGLPVQDGEPVAIRPTLTMRRPPMPEG